MLHLEQIRHHSCPKRIIKAMHVKIDLTSQTISPCDNERGPELHQQLPEMVPLIIPRVKMQRTTFVLNLCLLLYSYSHDLNILLNSMYRISNERKPNSSQIHDLLFMRRCHNLRLMIEFKLLFNTVDEYMYINFNILSKPIWMHVE